jgi:pimeloyl-ACP methyl ester carboxylesterase
MAINVYFVSGLSANCHVFDKIELPAGFEKQYIEWIIPRADETLEEYARNMAKAIDASQPFVLVGYSFGGMIIQEMNKFLHPVKNILIASVKHDSEMPSWMRFGRRIKFAERFPFWQLIDNKRVKDALAPLVYHLRDVEMSTYVTHTNPVYMQWSVSQILNWKPGIECPNLYHIHGTRDLTFPHKYINGAYLIEGGDHLMALKRPRKVGKLLAAILLGEIS